jgi:RNA polymerase sigma-70 factor (ECF subfamily)
VHPTEPDEHRLVYRARLGDVEAFGALVRLHQGRIRGFLRRLCRDHTQADDLAQECFLLAWLRIADCREAASLNAWLCSIAYRCFLQALRRERRDASAALLEDPSAMHEDKQEDGGRSAREQRALERAMQSLKPEEAAALTLHVSLGYSHGEVASILALPLGTVKSLIARGLPRLRAALNTALEGVHHEDH